MEFDEFQTERCTVLGTSTRYAHPLRYPHCALCVRVCIYLNGCAYRVEEPCFVLWGEESK